MYVHRTVGGIRNENRCINLYSCIKYICFVGPAFIVPFPILNYLDVHSMATEPAVEVKLRYVIHSFCGCVFPAYICIHIDII